MELSVVILNWNAAKDTIACLRYLNTWRSLRPVVWVVDNASTDDSVELILQEYPTIQLIQNSLNLGFAGGTNQGIRQSLKMGKHPILLLNNDAYIAESDVSRLLNTLHQNERIGFVAPLLFDAEQKDRLISAGGKNPVLHHQTRVQRFDPTDSLLPVEAISGTAVLIRAEVFEQVGLLDEDYFFSTELADLCTRARKQGFLNIVDTRARAYHMLSRSSNFRNTLYTYYIIRNRFLFIRKFYTQPVKALLAGFWSIYGSILTLKLLLAGQRSTASAVYLGTLDGWRSTFGGQNERVLTVCHNTTSLLKLHRFGQTS